MLAFFQFYKTYSRAWHILFLMLAVGIITGAAGASLAALGLFLIRKPRLKYETLLVLFLFTFFLGDNFEGPLAFANTLRFVMLGIALVVLGPKELLSNNVAWYIFPFAILATGITLVLSPLGIEAVARGLSYFLMALVLFKLVQLLILANPQRLYNLLILILALYVGVNFLLLVAPIFGTAYIKGRFTGLMGNPNGLGLVAMFSYAIVDVISRLKASSFSPKILVGFKVLLIVLILLTASRTSLLGVVAYELSVRLIKTKVLLVFALFLLLVAYNTLLNIDVEALIRAYGLADYLRVESLYDASGRTEVWQVAVDEIYRQPWWGKGMLYDGYYIDSYADRYIGEVRERHWGGVWSSYLSLLLNVGILGVLAFAYFWYHMYRLSCMPIVKTAFLIMCLLSALTESWMAASMNAFMPLVFLCWGLQIYQPIKLPQAA